MKRNLIIIFIFTAVLTIAFKKGSKSEYVSKYTRGIETLNEQQTLLVECIQRSNLGSDKDIEEIKAQINITRKKLKGLDFWFRYLDPNAYRKINGPLPVEWETEVFEKFEKPYKREGSGLTLAALYLDEEHPEKDSLVHLIQSSINAAKIYSSDSVTENLNSYHVFYLCNRLYLLNLAAIYTTGFECPDTSEIIPELRLMMHDVNSIYATFNKDFPDKTLPGDYMNLYADAIKFADAQPEDYSRFDHFTFIKNYINPLFILNQKMIKEYGVVSKSLIDYSLNKNAPSIFNKSLYFGQNPKGIYSGIKDEKVLEEIEKLGKLLFYDPILSGNNMRSCASCHNPKEYFTDTFTATSMQFNNKEFLARNSPSLLNAQFNHLLMLDGKQTTLQSQTKAVISNPKEMGCSEKKVMEKILSCKEYKSGFKSLLKFTPQEKEITIDHVVSAITLYYSKFSKYYSPFDDAMNENKSLEESAQQGFNLFMSKAQCATCHFVPQFNGVKPPYIGSEFEVLGVPKDTMFSSLGDDSGRYTVNPAYETMNAFRTGSIRNAEHTGPYMHNGVFSNLSQVINFYDAGRGAGRGIKVENQTLLSDSLHLSAVEKKNLIAFIRSLTENIPFDDAPEKLPASSDKTLNTRKISGTY